MSSTPNFPRLPLRLLAVAIVVLVVFIFSLLCYKIVPPGYRGVSVTLGRVSPGAIPEGMTFKKPFIEDIVLVLVKQVKHDGKATCFSSDLQTVDIQYALMMRIPEKSVIDLYQQYSGDAYSALVEPRLQEAIKQVTSRYTADNLVKSRDQIRTASLNMVRGSVGHIVDIVDLNIANIDLSDQLEKAIEQKMVKEQEALAKVYELEKANKEAQITIVNAKAEAEAVKIKGEALLASPKVIELEIVKRWDGHAPSTVVIGGDSAAGANIILPINTGTAPAGRSSGR